MKKIVIDDQLIIVTGGAGFIGSAVVRYLNDQGIENILIVDDSGSSEKWKNLVGKKFNDIVDKADIFKWLEKNESPVKAFIHLGACTSTVESNAAYLLDNNYRFSVQLVEYALNHGIRFIYASSAATYGMGFQGFCDDELNLDTLRPLNMYGYSKHLFDLWLKRQGLLGHVVGLKFFNVFGPNEYHKKRMASAIFHAFPIADKEGTIRLFKSLNPDEYANGEQKRDFIYVKDVARMVCFFLDRPQNGIFNVGSGVASSWNSVAKAIFKALNKEPTIHYIDMPTDLIGKYQNYTCADMKKTQDLLGQASICMTLENAILDYIQHHLIPAQTW